MSLILLCGSGPDVHDNVAARAFVVTDEEALRPFGFERVLTAVGAASPEDWLRTLRTTRTGATAEQPTVVPLAGSIPLPVNHLWRPAGSAAWLYVRPIAIVNRFDLAPANYSDCGEYRVIYSARSGERTRLQIAVEVPLPNPSATQRGTGCADVALFWWNLASTSSIETRRSRLEDFFFRGSSSLPPVLNSHAFENHGRIRVSEVGEGRPNFGQFELKRECVPAQLCRPHLVKVGLDNMPDAALFGGDSSDSAEAFRAEFLAQLPLLAIRDVNRYRMIIDRKHSVSDIAGLVPAFNYQLPFRRSQQSQVGRKFRDDIAAELRRIGSALRPEDIIGRAETQNCAGCHGKPGSVGEDVIFPEAFEEGSHILDVSLSGTPRLSPALERVFIPYRVTVLSAYVHALRSELPERPYEEAK